MKYTDYGNEQSSIKSEEDTINWSRYSLRNRQSMRDRRCLRKLEELSQSVRRTSFNNKKVKECMYFRWVQVSYKCEWNIQIMGMSNRRSNLRKTLFICPVIFLIKRQSRRDRRCLRKFEVLSQSVRRTSFNNNKVKDRIYFRWVQVSYKCEWNIQIMGMSNRRSNLRKTLFICPVIFLIK